MERPASRGGGELGAAGNWAYDVRGPNIDQQVQSTPLPASVGSESPSLQVLTHDSSEPR